MEHEIDERVIEEALIETKQQEAEREDQIEQYEDTLEYYRHIQS